MNLINLFFPEKYKCIFCGTEVSNEGICDKCLKSLPIIKDKICKKCGGRVSGPFEFCLECKNNFREFDRCFCSCDYDSKIKTKILQFKNNGMKYYKYVFAKLLNDTIENIDEHFDFIIPIPIHENRLKLRGYNQSELLAFQLDKKELVRTDFLFRIKDTPHQTGLNKDNRITNLTGAFKVKNKKELKNKSVLLLDDIFTTGSTINECAKILKKSGVKNVYALCLARTPLKNYLD